MLLNIVNKIKQNKYITKNLYNEQYKVNSDFILFIF